jgi:hypothetical protein
MQASFSWSHVAAFGQQREVRLPWQHVVPSGQQRRRKSTPMQTLPPGQHSPRTHRVPTGQVVPQVPQ